MRNEVNELLRLGSFPSSEDVIRSKMVDLVKKYQELILSIEKPVTDEEAEALARIFGVDDFFGLCWTLIDLIETAPNWPIEESFGNIENEWTEMLRDRAKRWRDAGYPARSFYTEKGLPDPRTTQN